MVKKVTGSTFTSPDPAGQRIGSTDGAKRASPESRLTDVRPLRTYQRGVVPSTDLALATRNKDT